MEDIEINGKNVTIKLLSKAVLQIWKDDIKSAEQLTGYIIDSEKIEDSLLKAFTIKLENMEKEPGNEKWYSYFAIIVNNKIIGSIGSKGKPDKDGMIEIGYGIAACYENKGYTTEAVSLFCKYFFSNKLVQAIKACTDLSNIASQRILIKNGFKYSGIEDEENIYILQNVV